MKQWIVVCVFVFIVLVLAGSIFALSNDKKALKETIERKNGELEALTLKNEELSAVTGLKVTGEEVAFVEKAFRVYLNYDNDSYVTRFNELSNFVELDVLNKLKGASSLSPPVVAMKNEVEDVQIYLNPKEPHTFLVYTTTNYFLDGALVNHGSQLYEVQVLKEQQQFILGEFKVIGNMTEVDGV